MPVLVNGRQLGVARNGIFTSANTDPIPGGRLWGEAAVTWNAMRLDFIADGGRPEDFEPAGPDSSARSRRAQDHFWTHQPPPAAKPYTSNHGWGIAVDVKTKRCAAWILRNGHRYGWSWDEGRRVGEWWHFRYVGASKGTRKRCAAKVHRWRSYSDSELRWLHEYDRLRHAHRGAARQAVLRRVMRAQRRRIWRAAQPRRDGGDGRGWGHANRRARYESMLARSR